MDKWYEDIEINGYCCDHCAERFLFNKIIWVSSSCGFCESCYDNWYKKLTIEEQEAIEQGGDF